MHRPIEETMRKYPEYLAARDRFVNDLGWLARSSRHQTLPDDTDDRGVFASVRVVCVEGAHLAAIRVYVEHTYDVEIDMDYELRDDVANGELFTVTFRNKE